MNEESTDVDFQAFLGRLRKAVKAHDVNTIAAMMTPEFAYVLGATPAEDRQGAGVFQYWDENGLWVELDGILSERFVAKGRLTWSRRRSLPIRRRITPAIAPASGGRTGAGNLSISLMADEAVTGVECRVNLRPAISAHHSSLVTHHFSSAPAAVRFR